MSTVNSQLRKIKKLQSTEGRIFFADTILEATGFKTGTTYNYSVDKVKRNVEIIQDSNSNKIVSHRKVSGNDIPLIDIRNQKVSEVLAGCDYLSVSIYNDKVVVTGHVKTATEIRETLDKIEEITSITFCAGGGVSAYSAQQAGIQDNYLLEFNPLDEHTQWDRYSNIAEKNHPHAVIINVPIEEFTASMLPKKRIDLWMATLPCNEYSIVKQNKLEETEDTNHSMHHFLHLVRIFTETEKQYRPEALFFENVPAFSKTAGKALEYFLRDQGYYVTTATIDGSDYGSRMHRERWYMVANVHAPYQFPEATGEVAEPFTSEYWFNLNDFEWKNPSNSPSIKRLLEREKRMGCKAMNIKAINPATEGISLTVPKNYRISVPQAMVKHPTKKDTYAIWPTNYLRRLFGVPVNFYLGESETVARETLGQSVDCNFLKILFTSLKNFMIYHRAIANLL